MEKNALIQLPPTDSPTPKCLLHTMFEETGYEIITGLPPYPFDSNATKLIWNTAKTREEKSIPKCLSVENLDSPF
jgi:hypothetical protein